MRRFLSIVSLPLLVACVTPESPNTSQPTSTEQRASVTRTGGPQTINDFRAVVRRVEPVAERACRSRTRGQNCDFDIRIDTRTELGANAYQTYDPSGRPVLAFTPALLRQMRNRDEVAFALSHEAAHHIRGHISQTQQTATAGAILGNVLGSVIGLDPSGVEATTNIGGTIGARRFSKGFELEADALGAEIAEAAGYDALRGVLYFQTAADPGDRFLGTHPPNADRIRIVRQTVGGR
jgi:predicted Zn-dependent protease